MELSNTAGKMWINPLIPQKSTEKLYATSVYIYDQISHKAETEIQKNYPTVADAPRRLLKLAFPIPMIENMAKR